MHVVGIWGEGFAASPIALKSQLNHVANEPIPTYGYSWCQHQSDKLTIEDWESGKKRRNCDGRAKCILTCCDTPWHWATRQCDNPNGPDELRLHWWTRSTRMEPCWPDRIICCWFIKENHRAADNASYSELKTGLRATNSAEHWDANAAQYVSRIIRPMYWSMTKV